MDKLVEYDWPGNVRELSNAVERAIIVHEGKPLSFEDIAGFHVADGRSREQQKPGAGRTLSEMEAEHIKRALEIAHGVVEGGKGAAAMLGMNPGTLRHRMRKLHIPFGRMAKAAYRKLP
jgi:DNA-binding NtrC family response regulator